MLLIVASTGAGFAVGALPRSYQSEASVVLLASPSASRQNGGNPYLSFSPSLTLTANALSQQVMAPATIQHLASAGSADPYTVALAPYSSTTTGSVLVITVTGSNPAAAQSTMHAVTGELSLKLSQLQSQFGIKPRDQVRTATLFWSPRATLSVSQTLRPLVIVTALGLLLVFGIPIVVDGRITRRRSRPARRFSERAPGHAAAGPSGATAFAEPDHWPLAEPDHWPAEPNDGRSRRAANAGEPARAGKSAG